MSREIKFRVWDKESNKFYFSGNNYPFHAMGYYLEELLNDSEIPVMQYIGLKDKNSVEIYEGDIVKPDRADNQIVEYYEGGFLPFAIPGWEFSQLPKHVTVIGNIYENKELLNG